jgi:hypothetical protein
MKKWMIALTLIALAIAVPLACSLAESLGAPAPGNGAVLLVEHLKQVRGRLINGTYPGLQLNGPDYSYDASHRLLSGSGIKSNDSLRLVLGEAESLSQDAGSGVVGDASGIYELPASSGGVAINSIAPDGTVTLNYGGSRIVLAPGERWEAISADVACTPNYSIRYIRSDLIRNQGYLAKDDIS